MDKIKAFFKRNKAEKTSTTTGTKTTTPATNGTTAAVSSPIGQTNGAPSTSDPAVPPAGTTPDYLSKSTLAPGADTAPTTGVVAGEAQKGEASPAAL